MRVRRRRTLSAPAADVWAVVADPWHLPRWWPRTTRVEAVEEAGWTSVLTSDRGRTVRADYAVEASEPPVLRRWAQELEDSPFARLFERNATEVRLTEAKGATVVELEAEQRLRGWARLAPFLVRRAVRTQLDEALGGLAGLVER
jgi:uncharacterized protein YndB with AHSA1/START domain